MFILGRKLKMSQIWEKERATPVTIIKADPNKISLIRAKDKDGYESLQLSLLKSKKEFRTDGQDLNLKVGDLLDVSAFNEGDHVNVSGVSKGRGFQGVVKRHGFGGGPRTHGQKNRFRAPGSIGSTAFQRVVPGRRMAGHMGVEKVTIKNLRVAKVDQANNLLYLEGATPGARGSLIAISKIRK